MASQTVQLMAVVNKHRPGLPHEVRRRAVIGLVRAARELSRIAEAECSVEMPSGIQKWVRAREEKLEGLVRSHARTLRCGVTLNGDPRGFSVLLHFGPDAKRQPGNTWGGTEHGWGIG